MANMIVSGAGTAAANGVYVDEGVIFNGKSVYSMDSPAGVNGRLHLIYSVYNNNQWLLSRRGPESSAMQIFLTNYYYANSNDPTPDLATNWNTYQGALPVPTVTADGGEPEPPATPWFLSGGIDPANCVAAYQAIGAESYAASKVNLANAGTYDLADGTNYPTWNAETGWTFNGTNQYLFAGSYPHSNVPFTVIVRAKFIISHNSNSSAFAISRGLANPSTGWAFKPEQFNNTGKIGLTAWGGLDDKQSALLTPLTDAVIAVTRNGTTINFYADGSTDTQSGATNIDTSNTGFYIGADYQPSRKGIMDAAKGEIYALAYYHTALTSAQIAAVSAAMNGEEPEPQTNIPVFMAHYRRLRSQ